MRPLVVSIDASERSGVRVTSRGAARTLDGIYREYARYVAAVGVRLLGRNAEIDDLVQEVFMAAVRGLDTRREPDEIRAWLATVTVRTARRRLRARRIRDLFGLDHPEDYTRLAARTADPEQRVLLARVYALLDRMPIEQRLAWSLRHLEGEQLDGVARGCDCSLATAKRRIAAAEATIAEAQSDE
jgi:RNA polymerase sigma-70 factor (ECF subfamily)